jgi:transposase InsO family protein
VAAHRHHGVVPICRVLQVAPSAVRSAMVRPACARRLADDAIKPKLLEVFNANYRVYGRRKMKAALRREHGIVLDKDRISRLMRELDIRGATRTKTTVTTRSDKSSPRAPDLVNRQFKASRLNQLWVCDFTYVPTWSGFAYTAFVTDVCSRMIVGWRTASTMTADLVTDALDMAIFSRRAQLLHGVIAHSDAGSQGGLNRSSQHLSMMEVCSGATAVVGRQGASPGDAVAGAAGAGSSCGARVLASDRSGQEHRGRCSRDRGVGPCRVALVPSRWRDATCEPRRTDRPVSVIR